METLHIEDPDEEQFNVSEVNGAELKKDENSPVHQNQNIFFMDNHQATKHVSSEHEGSNLIIENKEHGQRSDVLSKTSSYLGQLSSEYLQLFNSNSEIYHLSLLTLAFSVIVFFELVFGLILNETKIIGDSFFNLFKVIPLIITVASVFCSKSQLLQSFNNSTFKRNRIEIIAALANCVLLVIIALYMILNSMHIIAEAGEDEHHTKEESMLSFYFNFLIAKILYGTVFLLNYNDTLIHQSFIIKINLRKIMGTWKPFSQITLNNLSTTSEEIRNHTAHNENLNILCVSVMSDLVSTVVMYVLLFVFGGYYEKVYLISCFFNLFIISVLITPVFYSLINILMQGRNSMYKPLYEEVKRQLDQINEISKYEVRWWMESENELVCVIKAKVSKLNSLLNSRIKNDLVKSAAKSIGVSVKVIVDLELK